MKDFIERVRDTVRLHNRWKFSWKQAWRMTSPSFVVRLNGMKGQ